MSDRQRTGPVAGILRRLFGDAGERAAARFLRSQGLRIVARQFRTPWGELDLICMDGQTLVFVEVKTRRGASHREAAEAVDATKQQHLTRAALYFLKRHGLLEQRTRFDVVTIVWPDDAQPPDIRHFRSAFEAADFGQLY